VSAALGRELHRQHPALLRLLSVQPRHRESGSRRRPAAAAAVGLSGVAGRARALHRLPALPLLPHARLRPHRPVGVRRHRDGSYLARIPPAPRPPGGAIGNRRHTLSARGLLQDGTASRSPPPLLGRGVHTRGVRAPATPPPLTPPHTRSRMFPTSAT